MFRPIRRLMGVAAVGGLAAWWLRLLAHSKRAPAEGRWQELQLDDPPS
ncbi:MAG: hypothetical protein M3N53_05060 [Actinomycetota bacterium]|nr:hypothetical protein [Actinomycetota bacterium]